MSPARCAGVCAHVGVVGGAPPPPQLRSPSGMANSPSVTESESVWDGRKKRCSRRLPAPFRPTFASSDAAEQTGVMARGVVPNGRGSGRVHTPKRGPRHLHTREQNPFSAVHGGCRLQSGQLDLRWNLRSLSVPLHEELGATGAAAAACAPRIFLGASFV